MRQLIAVLAAVAMFAACSGDDDDSDSAEAPDDADTTTTVAPENEAASFIVFNGQGNDLAAYESEPPFTKQIVVPHYDEAEQPDGLDINGQICFDPENPRRFVAGEDTLQTSTGHPGWGIFELAGAEVGELSATQIGKLVPTYQSSADNAENYGCGFLADGRIVTTDVGNQAEGDGDGQLTVWFPPFDTPGTPFGEVAYCKIDVDLVTGQGVLVDDEYVYVAQARPPAAGIRRYAIADFPTGATPAGGCDSTDGTGAPMTTAVTEELFIEPSEANHLATPNAIAKGPDGTLFVTSVFNGVISEFEADGTFIRTVLEPPAGEALGPEPYSTGTPLGIGVGPDGSVYYADIGIVFGDSGIGPGRGTGKVRRIAFADDGTPLPPDRMDEGLAFPDGIGIWPVSP
ncbi:MAG: hypothetical protein SGJ13_09345 [Actinomycetota bacterium]|nr:hypothetical protein [Actinomycetota bacterium]